MGLRGVVAVFIRIEQQQIIFEMFENLFENC